MGHKSGHNPGGGGGGGGGNNDPQPCFSDLDVLKAKSEFTDLINDGTLIYMDPDLASTCGVEVGMQVRIRRNNNEYALYTVAQFYEDGSDNNDVRMALAGRQRLGTSDSMSNCDLFSSNPGILRNDLSDSELQSESEYGESLDDDGSQTGLVACAPHGGFIENYTDEQAQRLYSQLQGQSKPSSAWYARGYVDGGGAFDRWHITSTDISRKSFPLLDSIGDRGFTYAVSFHGMGTSGVLIGGGASQSLKEEVKAAIEGVVDGSVTVSIASSEDEYNGDSPDNFVNWLTANGDGGVQIEQSLYVRSNYHQAIADAVADVYAPKL